MGRQEETSQGKNWKEDGGCGGKDGRDGDNQRAHVKKGMTREEAIQHRSPHVHSF